VNKDLFECAELSLSQMKSSDMTVPWAGGLRTAALQNSIFKDGFSQLDGYELESYHQSGNALDVAPYKSEDEELAYHEFAALMFKNWLELGFTGLLEWGGHWPTFYDPRHWQVRL